ncbi:TrmB family transcriptional regulator [Haloarcula sp. Atlit-120R]|nr:TrmB family transcriptional regulator [Haloarcula sp. Atlit-120R]RLM45136.1 TrmB family transcriptional regulator [Haloarcula sp. Atlit-47R]
MYRPLDHPTMTELAELGLSNYEETAYRTLLVTGAVSASDLSDASGVPRGRIYDVLNGLEARGIVQTQPTDPTRYTPVDPETVVDRLLAERTRELASELDRYRSVAASVRADLLPTPPVDSSFWLGSLGSEEMRAAMRRHVRTAREHVRATVGPPYERASWETFQTEVDAFLDGVDNGVRVDLLCSEAVLDVLPESFPDLLADRNAAVRAVPTVGVSFDVIDAAAVTVDVPDPLSPADRLGVVGITDSEVAAAFEARFERLWAEAEPLLGR